MLAGALLRVLGIPVYFHYEWRSSHDLPHVWPVAYIFYQNSYQWVPAEPTHHYTNLTTYYAQQDYLTPFYYGATNWYSSSGDLRKTIKGYSNYYQWLFQLI